MAKKLQLLRNKTVFDTKALAISGLSDKLKTMVPGEPAIASYTDGDNIGILFGIALDATNYQIFEGAKVGEDGNLNIPQEVQIAIDKTINNLIGGATEDYNTLGKLEALYKKIQTELDNTQSNIGLSEDGSYVKETNSNYLNDAISFKDADKKLDEAIKGVDTEYKKADSALDSRINTLQGEVTKNKVVSGNGIDVNTDSTNTKVSVKIDESSESYLTVSEVGVKLSGIDTAITEAIDTIKGDAADYTTLGAIETKLDSVDSVLSDIKAYTINTKAINTNPILNGQDIKLDGYVISEELNESLLITTGDTINIAFGKVEKSILDNEEVTSTSFSKLKESIGLNANLEFEPISSSNYISTATSIQNSEAILDATIKDIDDSYKAADSALGSRINTLQGEVTKNKVVSGDGINVNTEGENTKVSVVAKIDDPIIEVTSEGIKTKSTATIDCGFYYTEE